VAASERRPCRSSSNPWPIAWAASGAPPPSASARSALRTRGRSRRIQTAEIFEDEAALLRGHPGQLFPRGILETGPRAGRPGRQGARQVHAVTERRTAGALAVFVRLGTGQRAARIEQAAIQPLLSLDGLAIEPPRVELARQLARLLRQRPGGRRRPFGPQALELLPGGAHLPLGKPDRALQPRGHQRVLAGGLTHLPGDGLRPFLDRRLLGAGRGAAGVPQPVGHLLLALSERRRLAHRAIEG